jgi:AbrB family looped-hinge helix DNA binding protein
MAEPRPYKTRIRDRGQLTIPKEIREKGAIDAGEAVTIIPVGEAILVSPQKLGLEEARREFLKLMKRSGVTAEELLRGLKEERGKLYEETYGTKDD